LSLQLASFTADVRRLLNPEDEEDEEEEPRFEVVNAKTYHMISSCVYQAVEREVEVLDWSIAQMKTATAAANAHDGAGDSQKDGDDEDQGQRVHVIEQEVFVRFTNIEKVLLSCIKANMTGITVEVLLRVITKWYRCLTNLVKYVSALDFHD